MILVIKEILYNLILNSNTNHTSEQKPASTVQEHASWNTYSTMEEAERRD